MRPKGKQEMETDVLVVKIGVNAIAFPAEQDINLAESMFSQYGIRNAAAESINIAVRHAQSAHLIAEPLPQDLGRADILLTSFTK